MSSSVPRIFVINMAKDAPRRLAMAQKAQLVGLEVEFFDAVNGRELTPLQWTAYDSERRRKYFGRDLLPGEVGCLLSHRAIYEKMDKDAIPMAVVLEDDVLFEPDVRDVLSALPLSPVPWDVVRFLGSPKIYKRGCRIIAPLVGRYALARLPTTPGGAHGYMITLEAARTMLRHMQRSWLPIDTLQGRMWETGLETLVVYPAPLYPDQQEASTIGDKRFDKTVQLSGVDRWLYPLFRGWFRFSETLGKKYIYYSSWWRDRSYPR